ncbi:MAG TPA: D-alanyl-D-alanine carboxypeptidase, partial [Trebonia sp.]
MRIASQVIVAGVVAGVVASGLAATPAAAAARTALPASPTGVRAPYAELANAVSGADLWSRSSVTERPMGSITKVMTAYVVIEAGHLNRVITVPKGIVAYDNKYQASTAGLVPGEKLTAQQLLYALLIPSGCDAAYALAAGYGPGLAQFIAKMNSAARGLGLTKTHFSDFSGLPD